MKYRPKLGNVGGCWRCPGPSRYQVLSSAQQQRLGVRRAFVCESCGAEAIWGPEPRLRARRRAKVAR